VVVSVGKATSADYYVGGGGVAEGAESYVLDAVADGEQAGRWCGSGADRLALGLSGDVYPEDMRTVYGEFLNPRTGEAIGLRPPNRRSVDERLAGGKTWTPLAVRRVRHVGDGQSGFVLPATGWARQTDLTHSISVGTCTGHQDWLWSVHASRSGGAISRRTPRGGPRPADDTWIAACCLVRDLPLITYNRKDYEDFADHEGLRLLPL
jgi:hypothetical protein